MTTSTTTQDATANTKPANSVSYIMNAMTPMLKMYKNNKSSETLFMVEDIFRTLLIGLKVRGLRCDMHDWENPTDTDMVQDSIESDLINLGLDDDKVAKALDEVMEQVLRDKNIQPAMTEDSTILATA